MQNNFYFLRQLSPDLSKAIAGFTLVSCFSQNKEELILEFNNARSSFFLKASLTPAFTCLSFPSTIRRARQNTVDIFPTITMKKVAGVRQFDNERSFSIELEGSHHLLFKMHGNRANVILFRENEPLELFKNQLKGDLELRLDTLDRTIDWSLANFHNQLHRLREVYFTFGKEVWRYLDAEGFEEAATAQRWELLVGAREKLEHPRFFILEEKNKLVFSLLPGPAVQDTYTNPLEAITSFYAQFVGAQAIHHERSAALRMLESQLMAGTAYIEKNSQKLKDLVPDTRYQQWADLIMANMSRVKTGMGSVTLENLYDEMRPLEIPLKKELNAQRNAEVFYRKARNQQIEVRKLQESIEKKQKELEIVRHKIVLIKNEPELRNIKKHLGTSVADERAIEKSLPYQEVEFKGYKIWIGKNAVANDTLTQKYSHKEDLWLHAKDVAGSHTLLKYQAGKPFPKDVIERAAQLAAYHSKRRHESLCPVTVTPKKFVRKRKGAPAGSVVVDREDVLLVVPTAN